jgi:hypothetical protein
MVKKCIEDRVAYYKNKAEKRHLAGSASKSSPASMFLLATMTFAIIKMLAF